MEQHITLPDPLRHRRIARAIQHLLVIAYRPDRLKGNPFAKLILLRTPIVRLRNILAFVSRPLTRQHRQRPELPHQIRIHKTS
ncbi:hypothetical protein COMA2_120064 [Candidatus Nitrospira nitrificans]|uniref:Uncharacterized protein n=1 Tax=Candidatus Nitrospira nitrificans TaxID=1742973 RepID=A0A0S4LD48_9BACT|nr:hypothetical protein COMA2_120064 [Candidatus Nitrospira nitrificans]